MSRAPLHVALSRPSVLSRLLVYIDWPAFHQILNTCTDTRHLFDNPALRNVILAHFIPGLHNYRHSAASNLHPLRLIPILITHLHLFLISQKFPVQLYPAHALRSLTSINISGLDGHSELLVALTQAHSRVYLFLQTLVHSSSSLVISSEDSHGRLFKNISPSLPELTFPAPLSYQSIDAASVAPQSQFHFVSTKSKRKGLTKTVRRLSLFRSGAPPLPAPVAKPHALNAYSFSWRRSYLSKDYPVSDQESDLKPPRRHYVSSTSASRSNTNSQSSLSRSSTPTPPTSNASPSPPPSPKRSPLSLPTPHDFIHATSPSRAPVLRVYIPCSDPILHPQTIIRCEEQLINTDLWQHLSIGDIVVNLGHVPLSNTSDARLSTALPIQRPHRGVESPTINWLIFNGNFLVPFTASPGAPVPVPDALSLPSPFYYTHILPRLSNPVFSLRRMPRFSTVPLNAPYPHVFDPELEEPPMRLVYIPTRVPTSRGNGVALVKKYKWLTRVYVNPHIPGMENQSELGVGWQGEWVLESEGTKEGRDTLLDWLVGRASSFKTEGKGKEKPMDDLEWEWELVRERCRKGRIWMRLLDVLRMEEYESELS